MSCDNCDGVGTVWLDAGGRWCEPYTSNTTVICPNCDNEVSGAVARLIAERDEAIARAEKAEAAARDSEAARWEDACRFALADVERLRVVISKVATELGSWVQPSASIEFMEELPREAMLVMQRLRSSSPGCTTEPASSSGQTKPEPDQN